MHTYTFFSYKHTLIHSSRYTFRTELTLKFWKEIRESRGKGRIKFSMRCQPDEVGQLFNVLSLRFNDRRLSNCKTVRVVEKPKVPSRVVNRDLLRLDVPQPGVLTSLLGDEYYRYIIQRGDYEGAHFSHIVCSSISHDILIFSFCSYAQR